MPLDYADQFGVVDEAASSILGNIPSFTLATVADVGTSLWNSLPFTPEVKTEDLLSKVSDDALAIYKEHPDAVHTASLIAGTIAPAGLTLKLLGRARAGVKALGYSTNEVGSSLLGQTVGSVKGARQLALQSEIETLLRNAGKGTTEYKKLTRQVYIANGLQQVADNALIELAVVGALNAHPYMEDYMENPVTNFALFATVGGLIGMGLSIPLTSGVLRRLESPIEREAIDLLFKSGYKTAVFSDLTNTAQYQGSTANIKTLTKLIERNVPGGYKANLLSADIANSLLLIEGERRDKSLIRMFPAYEKASPEIKTVINQLASRPDMVGVDTIRWYDLNRFDKATARIVAIEDKDSQINAAVGIGNIPKSMVEAGKPVIAFARLGYSGQLEVFAASGVRNAARAIDIKDAAVILKSGRTQKDFAFAQPIKDFAEDNLLRGVTSAETDLRFLTELKGINNLTKEQVPYIVVAPDDLARQNAIVSWLHKLTPDELAVAEVKITSNYPTYEATQQFVAKTVGPNYLKNLLSLTTSKGGSLFATDLSTNARKLLDAWIEGGSGIARARRAFDAFLHKTHHTNIGDDVETAREIWEAGAAYRKMLKAIADSDGYVYLYRGTRAQLKSSSSVESFTASANVASYFGGAKLYKVHTDNVIGTVGNASHLHEAEILVSSPHHQLVNNLPVETGKTAVVDLPIQETKTKLSAESFLAMYEEGTEQQVRNMLSNGFSLEEISSRTNAQVDVLRFVAAGGHLVDYPGVWRRYTDVTKLDEYLSPKNKLFAIIGNPVKNPTGEAINKLDSRFGSIAHKEQLEQLTHASNSEIANKMLTTYTEDSMKLYVERLHTNLAEIHNSSIGDPRWQSADNTLRGISTGPTITYMGKQIIDNVDGLKRKFLEPVSAALLPFKDKPTTLIELNATISKLAGLKSWRDMVVDKATGKATIVQRVPGVTPEGKAGLVLEAVKNADGSDFVIHQPEVINFINSTRELSRELYKIFNLNRTITGQAALSDLGLWMPSISLVNKTFAFVVDPAGKQNVRLLVATQEDELKSLIHTFKQENPVGFDIVTKEEQARYNLLKGYSDYEAFTTYANPAAKHKGASASALPITDDRLVSNILQSYENLILQSSRKYSEIYLADTMQWLDNLSTYYRRYTGGQPLSTQSKKYTPDSAITIKNILLGRDQLEQSPTLRKINTLTNTLINHATVTLDRFINITKVDKIGTKAYYNGLNQQLKKVGIDQPLLGSFHEYLAGATPQTKDISSSVISAGNGLMATLMLRMLEMAQPMINIMSLPILTSSALMEKLPGTIINATGDKMVFPLRQMMDGIRSMNNAERVAIEKSIWEPRGMVKQTVRQYTEVLGIIHQAPLGKTFSQRAVDAVNDFQNSALIKDYLAKPADWAEDFTRRFAMHTGFDAAKRAYPGIDDAGATIMAVNFSDRAIGNYHAAQRPTLFQGSFGAGIGLFQTYFLSFAQSIYRGLEERNFKQLASLMLAQTGIFGMASWPGYHLLSENIVSHVNDNHYDITTGIFRAVNDQAAELILYGLPSSLGPAFYTRGDISPRIPSTMTEIAVLSGVKEGYNAIHRIISGVARGIPEGTGTQSLFEALSLQSLNRPIARWSELVAGHSITRQGNTVSPTAEVWSPMGVAARLLSTRPIEEQVLRNAIHLNQYYKSLDHDRRQAIMNTLKTAVRAGNLTDKLLGETALDYIGKGGNATGWQSAINQVLIESPEGARMDLLRKLEPTNPLNRMIKDLY